MQIFVETLIEKTEYLGGRELQYDYVKAMKGPREKGKERSGGGNDLGF